MSTAMNRPRKKIVFIAVALAIGIVGYAGYVASCLGSHRHKLWLHRCNSTEKFDEMSSRFVNVETDVVYRGEGLFDVTHDLDVTYHLPLDSLFSRISGQRQRHIWIDLKNLTPPIAEEIDRHLTQLCAAWNVHRTAVIVESKSHEALSILTKKGWYTSYYVDFPYPSKLSTTTLDSCLAHIHHVAHSNTVCALSFPGWWYPHISPNNVSGSIDLLTWKHRTTEFEFFAWPPNRAMLADPRLKVILLKAKGKYHR